MYDGYSKCYITIEIFFTFVRLNRKAKYNLEKDLANKFSALRIDEHHGELRNNSAGLHFVPGAAKISAKYLFNFPVTLFFQFADIGRNIWIANFHLIGKW
jgi:Tektin family